MKEEKAYKKVKGVLQNLYNYKLTKDEIHEAELYVYNTSKKSVNYYALLKKIGIEIDE